MSHCVLNVKRCFLHSSKCYRFWKTIIHNSNIINILNYYFCQDHENEFSELCLIAFESSVPRERNVQKLEKIHLWKCSHKHLKVKTLTYTHLCPRSIFRPLFNAGIWNGKPSKTIFSIFIWHPVTNPDASARRFHRFLKHFYNGQEIWGITAHRNIELFPPSSWKTQWFLQIDHRIVLARQTTDDVLQHPGGQY